MKLFNRVVAKFSILILGKRPFNTIFSFNYHNINHIVKFQKSCISEYFKRRDFKLLDIGAGASPYYMLFEKYVLEYTVIDVKSSLPENEKRAIKQLEGFAENLPVDADSFDIVVSNQVLEHVNDDIKAVKESARVLKQNGLFIGSVPHISPIHLEPYDFRRYTELGLKKVLEENGFEVIKIEGNGGVHKALALTLTMDWFLTKYQEGQSQIFHNTRHLILFPVTGFINLMAIILDYIIGDKKRSPSNYCWIAKKK